MAVRKGIFRRQLVDDREVPGSRDVTYPCRAKEALGTVHFTSGNIFTHHAGLAQLLERFLAMEEARS